MRKLTCSTCGELKTGSYVKESRCGKCKNERRKIYNKEVRALAGLPAWGIGRDPNCKICRNVKEISYKNGNYCKKCKLERAKIDYKVKRDSEGKSPRRIGRNPICKCGITKENPKESLCVKCNNAKHRLLYAAKKQNPDFMEAQREKNKKRYAEQYEHRLKRMCREATRRRIQAGILTKGNCEVCGNSENIQAHHEDYRDPMNVKWLCSWHHAALHKQRDINDNDTKQQT